MTQDEIIEMARQADIDHHKLWNDDGTNRLEAFAKLVAKHTLMNIDPSKFIGGYREGFEAGVAKEREACAQVCEGRLQEGLNFDGTAEVIRGRAYL